MATTQTYHFEPFTDEEAKALFEKAARRYMDMSSEEFLQKWDSGLFTTPLEKARARRVVAYLPLIRDIRVSEKYR
jgi:hypothetical protein